MMRVRVKKMLLKEKPMFKLALIVLTCLTCLGPVGAQTALKTVAGDYEGTYGSCPFHLRLHVRLSSPTTLTGTLDAIDEDTFGIPCTEFVLSGTQFSFTLPSTSDNYKGEISADGNTITGTLNQATLYLWYSRGWCIRRTVTPGNQHPPATRNGCILALIESWYMQKRPKAIAFRISPALDIAAAVSRCRAQQHA
jgi:hypothetical protein